MNIQEEIKALKERIYESEELIAKLEEHIKKEQEFPKDGDTYWMVDDSGDLFDTVYVSYQSDEYRKKIGNMYKTEGEARFALEKTKVEGEWREFSRPFVWGEENWFITIEDDKDILIEYDNYAIYQGTVYFESKGKVKEAIESVGEERIKKYIFGLED
jgi:hypothetical protein